MVEDVRRAEPWIQTDTSFLPDRKFRIKFWQIIVQDQQDRLGKSETSAKCLENIERQIQGYTTVLQSAFTKCCKETGFLMVVKCRQENTALKDCLVGYYTDPSFYEECKAEYLKQREEYRATGIKKKRQKITSNV